MRLYFVLSRLCAIFAVVCVFLLSSDLLAREKFEKIAVVDVNEIFQTSLVTVSLNEQLQTKQAELKKQFEIKEKELRDVEKTIETQRGVLTESALQEKINAFNQSVAEIQNKSKAHKLAVEKSYFATLESINVRLKDIISKYSVEHGIDLVLHKVQVVYRSSSYPDVTRAIIEKLNKDLPYIKMLDVEHSPSLG